MAAETAELEVHEEHDTQAHYRWKSHNMRWGLWLFIFSDAFVFAGLFVVRFNLLGDSRPELNQTIGLIVTVLLLLSSVLMNRAEIAVAAGDQKGFLRNILGTIVLGTIFLIGVVGVEWPLALTHFGPDTGVVGGVFFTMTGMHALHVLSGVLLLWFVYRNGQRGLYTAERHWPVEAVAVYWHFVDVVWVFFYPALYLIGSKVIGG